MVLLGLVLRPLVFIFGFLVFILGVVDLLCQCRSQVVGWKDSLSVKRPDTCQVGRTLNSTVNIRHMSHVLMYVCAENEGDLSGRRSSTGWLLVWSVCCHRDGVAVAAAGFWRQRAVTRAARRLTLVRRCVHRSHETTGRVVWRRSEH